MTLEELQEAVIDFAGWLKAGEGVTMSYYLDTEHSEKTRKILDEVFKDHPEFK